MKCATRTTLSFLTVALVAVASGQQPLHAAELQYGFDSLVGSVGLISNDGSAGAQRAGPTKASP